MMPNIVRTPLNLLLWMAAVCLAGTSWGVQGAAVRQASGPAQAPAETRQLPIGQRVVAVRILTEEGVLLRENPPGLPIEAGQEFQPEPVREALRQLYRSGDYADVRAETAPVAGGLRLDFVVRRNFFVNDVRVIGLREPPSEDVAVAALRLSLGDIFRPSSLEEALERLHQTLREEGLYQAKTSYELLERPETRQMDIVVSVTAGPRARVAAIDLRNHTEFPDAELLRRSKLKPGQQVTSARQERASERVRKFLAGRGRLSSRVTLRRGDYDPKTDTVPFSLEVIAGAKVRAEVAGVKISSGDLRKLLPIYQEGAVDEDLLQEGRRNIRDFLERQGYFEAQVRYTVSTQPPQPSAPADSPAALSGGSPAPPEKEVSEQVITYVVERGPRRRLVGVAFMGNKYFSDELLRGRLSIQPAAFASRGRFSRRLLDEDTGSIRALYVANGFENVQVRSEVIEDYQGREGDLFVRFHIVENPQTLVAELKLEGNQTLSDDKLLSGIDSTPGQPYSDFNVSGDRDNILALYYNAGFPEARFSAAAEVLGETSPSKTAEAAPTAAFAEGGKRVRLIYRITEGPQLRVAHVLISGYEHTRRSVITRQVQLQAGGPLSEGQVVETQRRLYNLGVFSRVSIAPQNPKGTDLDKTVVVLVEEAKRYTLGYGFGIEAQRLASRADPTASELRFSPRGIFEFSKINFTGRADTISFKGRASTLQGRALLSYTAQNYFGRPYFNLQVTGFADKTRDINTFTATRYEGSAVLAQRVSDITSFFYRYAFRRVAVDPGSLRIAPERIPLFSQPTKISAVGATWMRDTRNNPTDPSKGRFTNVDISIAGRPIGSSTNFLRFFVQNSSFHPIGRRLTFARSARFGVETPVGGTISTQIPLPERFFAGGGNSLRGFGLNQAGPRDPQTGFPIGGLAMLVLNQELRFPMRLPFIGTRVGGAIFYDAGNVFSRFGRITLRPSPPQPVFDSAGVCQFNCTNELNYFSHTIGFGIRYVTPIGPVRVDLGYQLTPAQFVAACTAGSPGCPGGQTLVRLPRFQFFFNVGSIF